MSDPQLQREPRYRSLRGVRRSKTPMDQQESGEKKRRPLLVRVLERFRAEFKIRKIWRMVQRAATFVPSKILGWLKAVRACLNLKLIRAPPETDEAVPGISFPHGRSLDENISRYIPPVFSAMFTNWWTWTSDDNGSHGASSFRGKQPAQDRDWHTPPALGGPDMVLTAPVVANEEVTDAVKPKVFTWNIFPEEKSGSFGKMIKLNRSFDDATSAIMDSRVASTSARLQEDMLYFESNAEAWEPSKLEDFCICGLDEFAAAFGGQHSTECKIHMRVQLEIQKL